MGSTSDFTTGRKPKGTLIQVNRNALIIGDAVVTASTTSLSVFLPPSTDTKSSGIQFADPAGYPTLIALILVSGQGISPLRFLAHDARAGTTPEDSAFTPPGVCQGAVRPDHRPRRGPRAVVARDGGQRGGGGDRLLLAETS